MGKQHKEDSGDLIFNGTIRQGQGFSIGQGSSARLTVIGNLSQEAMSSIDLAKLKESLTELYQHLAEAPLPVENKMKLQTLTGQAVAASSQAQPDVEALAGQIKQLGEAFRSTGETLAEAATIKTSLLKIAGLVGPLVTGGARVVASWFGLHIPR